MEDSEEFDCDIDSHLNINSSSFNPDLFLQETFKECSLKRVMDLENEVARDTATLHSDMQTLVYENYNKFISATDTVRKMSSGFKQMEAEMEDLSKNMNSITSLFDNISGTLQDSRSQISHLTSVHSLLNSLQFVFKLPTNLQTLISEGAYSKAAEDYLYAQSVLKNYAHLPSFQEIQTESEAMVKELKEILHEKIRTSPSKGEQLTEAVDLLLKLKEPGEDLCKEYLSYCDEKLAAELETIKSATYVDLIEFVDAANTGFISDLSLFVQSYGDMFLRSDVRIDLEDVAEQELNKFVTRNMESYVATAESVFEKNQQHGDTIILVRALDRFYRRLQSVHALLQGFDFLTSGAEVVIRAGRRQARSHLQSLKTHFTEQLTRLRQALASMPSVKSPTSPVNDQASSLQELLQGILLPTSEKVKVVLQDLMIFLQPDITFGMNARFQEVFCVDSVREGLVIGFFHYLTATARGFCDSPTSPPTLLLILSKFCQEFQDGLAQHLILQTDEWFNMKERPGAEVVTGEGEVCTNMKESAQCLLNSFVRAQGQNISQMLRKSVETRDWLNTIEPRTVRAVMKRVVEDVSAVESQVGTLYEEGAKSERSSESSRKTQGCSISQVSKQQAYRSNFSSYAPGHSSLVPSLHKLFSERIEFFTSVEFSKVSILTGIIKISLKTLLECVRLRTFSRYGLQQIQVDVHYLQLYLWRFVADENLVHFLLDEILGSAVQRCLDPVLMEPSVVEIICERG